ncbi:unnamed protein product, partial [Lymnaea stagnalis]
ETKFVDLLSVCRFRFGPSLCHFCHRINIERLFYCNMEYLKAPIADKKKDVSKAEFFPMGKLILMMEFEERHKVAERKERKRLAKMEERQRLAEMEERLRQAKRESKVR